jgi:hypothetical protein
MANLCGASLQCVAIRVTELDQDGAPQPGNAMYVTDNLVKIDFNPDIETGQEISNKKASGDLCVVWRTPDLMKRLTVEVEVCVPDPELEVLLSGGDLFTQGTAPNEEVMGWSYPALLTDPTPNGVSVEAWTRYVVDGIQPPDQPYIWWVFPRMKLRKGNRTIDVNAMANVYDGFALENPSWQDGPLNDWDWPSDRVVQAAFTDTYPTPECGGQDVPGTAGPATGANAGSPGLWTPSGATPPTSVANLIAGVPGTVVASPNTAWTTGQYVQTGTAGSPGQAYWSGSAWVGGTAP